MSGQMRRRGLHGLAAGIVMIACGGVVGLAQSKDPAYGVWKLNVAKSKYSPGPAPKEMTVTIEGPACGAGECARAAAASAATAAIVSAFKPECLAMGGVSSEIV